MTKRCSNCYQTKPITEFYRKLDRHQSRCIPCNKEIAKFYALRARERAGYKLSDKDLKFMEAEC